MDTNKPIRILHIVGRMDRGGIETMIMNWYRNIDRSKVQFDFLAHYGKEAEYNEEIRSLGGKIYEMPTLKKDDKVYYWKFFEYIFALNKFFKTHKEYKIIHCHMTNTASIYMPIAKKYGITCRIAHSHSSFGKAGLLGVVTDFLQKSVYKNSTDWFACSKMAAEWLFPKWAIEQNKVQIIPNAVDASKFRFSKEKRKKIRKTLNVENKLVVGCVGRFRKEKNQIFLINILKELLNYNSDSILLFVGDGPLEQEVKEYSTKLGVKNNTVFLGSRNDVNDLMQAMDVLMMPSLFEGLPVTGIEAQASGLPVIASNKVTKEMNILNLVTYISLTVDSDMWVNAILLESSKKRNDTYNAIVDKNYDIKRNTKWLQDFYLTKKEKRNK